jgi:hypothetical protein
MIYLMMLSVSQFVVLCLSPRCVERGCIAEHILVLALDEGEWLA